MYKPPKIQVQFLIEPPDAPIAEYNRPLPKFVNVKDILDSMLRYSIMFVVFIGILILTIMNAVLDRK
jgi:hypothetical protein